MTSVVLKLTAKEAGALKEAIRYSQETYEETFDTLEPTLSRIQRKLGQEAHS